MVKKLLLLVSVALAAFCSIATAGPPASSERYVTVSMLVPPDRASPPVASYAEPADQRLVDLVDVHKTFTVLPAADATIAKKKAGKKASKSKVSQVIPATDREKWRWSASEGSD